MNETDFKTEENKLTVTRNFDAPVSLVWKAWTEPDLLDQWWAPKPWKSKTKHMDFKEGGYRLYAMVGPEGEEHWGRSDYRSIEIFKSFSGADAFCDPDGNINPSFPVAEFTNAFHEASGQTEVSITTLYASKEHLDQVLEMGMKEGLTAALDNLDQLLQKNR